jgi:hypothetical protein
MEQAQAVPAVDRAAIARDVVAWTCAVIVTLLAIGAATDRTWLAVGLLLLSALIAIPPIRRRLAAVGVPRWMRIAVPSLFAFAGMLAIGAAAPQGAGAGSTPAPPMIATRQASVRPAPALARKIDIELATSQTKAFWQDFMAEAKRCDSAGEAANHGLDRGSVYSAYSSAKVAADTCGNAADNIGSLEVPPEYTGEAKKVFGDAIVRCSYAYGQKSLAYTKMLNVIDGDARPSVVEDDKETMKSASDGIELCVTDLMDGGYKAGIPSTVFSPE